MDDFSSSRIHEDAIIFSTRKINAWNATMQRGSIIILGGDREMLRDVLDYKRATVTTNTELLCSRSEFDHAGLAQCNSKANATAQRHDLVLTTSSSAPPDDGFHLIQANDMKDNLATAQGGSETADFLDGNPRVPAEGGSIVFVFRTH